MSSISEIEDKLIDAVKDLDSFRIVDSLGRNGKPPVINYPSAFVFFADERATDVQSRPIRWLTYVVLVFVKNMASEAKAAKDAYTLIDAVDGAINGKRFGLTDIEAFRCSRRKVEDYDAGTIVYSLSFTTRHYLPVPVPG